MLPGDLASPLDPAELGRGPVGLTLPAPELSGDGEMLDGGTQTKVCRPSSATTEEFCADKEADEQEPSTGTDETEDSHADGSSAWTTSASEEETTPQGKPGPV